MPGDNQIVEDIDHLLGLLYHPLAREARRLHADPPRTMHRAIADYVGCEVLHLRKYETAIPDGDGLLHAVHALVEEAPAGWTIHPRRANQFDDRIPEAITYTEVETGPEVRTYCFSGGYLFVESPEGRWVVFVGDREYTGSRTLDIYLPDGSEEKVRAIIDRFHAIRLHRSRHKGQRVSASDQGFRFLTIDEVDWDDLVFEPYVIDELQRSVFLPIREPERWRLAGLPLKRSLLLSGPPGVGKTLIGRLIASKIPETFVWVTAEGFADATKVRQIYQMARENKPTILFLEDIDLAVSRGGSGASVLGEVLAQTDGMEANDLVITIATTNRPEEIDEALKDRPGRFDRHIEIEPPSDELRARMIRRFCERFHLSCSEETLKDLVARTAGLTGAHLHELVMATAIEALDKGWDPKTVPVLGREMAQFLKAAEELSRVRPGIGFRT